AVTEELPGDAPQRGPGHVGRPDRRVEPDRSAPAHPDRELRVLVDADVLRVATDLERELEPVGAEVHGVDRPGATADVEPGRTRADPRAHGRGDAALARVLPDRCHGAADHGGAGRL